MRHLNSVYQVLFFLLFFTTIVLVLSHIFLGWFN